MAKYSTISQISDLFATEACSPRKRVTADLKLTNRARKVSNKTTKVAQRMIRLHLDAKRMLDGTKITWR